MTRQANGAGSNRAKAKTKVGQLLHQYSTPADAGVLDQQHLTRNTPTPVLQYQLRWLLNWPVKNDPAIRRRLELIQDELARRAIRVEPPKFWRRCDRKIGGAA